MRLFKSEKEQEKKDSDWTKSITGMKFNIPNFDDLARLEKLMFDNFEELKKTLEELKKLIDEKVDKEDGLDS